MFLFQQHSPLPDCLMLDTTQDCGSCLWHEDKYSKWLNNLTFKVRLLVCIFPHQKKALREKWLLDGLSSLTPKEQEEMQKQNREDQQRTHELEQEIFRWDRTPALLFGLKWSLLKSPTLLCKILKCQQGLKIHSLIHRVKQSLLYFLVL